MKVLVVLFVYILSCHCKPFGNADKKYQVGKGEERVSRFKSLHKLDTLLGVKETRTGKRKVPFNGEYKQNAEIMDSNGKNLNVPKSNDTLQYKLSNGFVGKDKPGIKQIRVIGVNNTLTDKNKDVTNSKLDKILNMMSDNWDVVSWERSMLTEIAQTMSYLFNELRGQEKRIKRLNRNVKNSLKFLLDGKDIGQMLKKRKIDRK
ncbi:Hypothetical predicted protein [Mytilus galloprovincialis]|uniref:Uncharacterized protein n=1 Tax=Mytilus galloprovincialis TaxID=29158 RepID=A0A8B6BNB2_MYTGA|nr:Hypothetical predicted protein [Mytilus galloprovincialis]